MEFNELIEALRYEDETDASAMMDYMEQAADMLESQQDRITELEAADRWIPVTERLPDLVPCGAGTGYSEAVNVLTDGRKVLTAVWNGSRFLCDADYWEAWGEKITHWTPVLLPLPEPPKEGNDGN